MLQRPYLWEWEQNCFDQFVSFTGKQGIVGPSGLISIWHGLVSQLSVWRSVSPVGIFPVSNWWPVSPSISIRLTTTLASKACFWILYCRSLGGCLLWTKIGDTDMLRIHQKVGFFWKRGIESELRCCSDVSLLQCCIIRFAWILAKAGFAFCNSTQPHNGQRTVVILLQQGLLIEMQIVKVPVDYKQGFQ